MPLRATSGDGARVGLSVVPGFSFPSTTSALSPFAGGDEQATAAFADSMLACQPSTAVSLFGAKGDGVTDDSLAFQQAFNSAAGAGLALYIGRGIYVIGDGSVNARSVQIPDGLVVVCSPKATIIGANPNVPAANAMFVASAPAQLGSTSLSGPTSLGGRTISVSVAAGISPGLFLSVTNAVSGIRQFYEVILVVGTTVTVDRPILWPFLLGDTVQILASPPPQFSWYGNGCRMGGRASLWFFGSFWKSLIDGVSWTGINGANNDACAGFHTGSYGCGVRRCYVDALGAGANLSTCLGQVATEQGFIEDCAVENVGANASAYEINDCRCQVVSGCRAAGAKQGIVLGTDAGVGTQVSRFVTITGCSIEDCGVGVLVQVSDGVTISSTDFLLESNQKAISAVGVSDVTLSSCKATIATGAVTTTGVEVGVAAAGSVVKQDVTCDFTACASPAAVAGAGSRLTGQFVGTGDPSGVVIASIGSTYQRVDGGAGTSFYVKEANNTTSAGWQGK